jgi:hypothetical protein
VRYAIANTPYVSFQKSNSSPIDANKVRRFGGAYKIVYLPDTLVIVQRGRDLRHYEIVPSQANLLNFEQFNEELRKIQAIEEE